MRLFGFVNMCDHVFDEEVNWDNDVERISLKTAPDFESAKKVTKELYEAGYGCIEYCGAFSREMCDELMELTNHEVAIGAVTHNPVLDPVFDAYFGSSGTPDKKRKFACFLMGDYTPAKKIQWEDETSVTSFFTVKDYEEAKKRIVELYKDGYGCIELCGAFNMEHCDEYMELTNGEVAIGCVTHNPVLDNVFEKFFS